MTAFDFAFLGLIVAGLLVVVVICSGARGVMPGPGGLTGLTQEDRDALEFQRNEREHADSGEAAKRRVK